MSAPTNLEAIQAVLSSERFLDEPVSEYKPKSIGKKFDLGTSSTLREYYKQNLLNVPGRIVVGTAEKIAAWRAERCSRGHVRLAPTSVLRNFSLPSCLRVTILL